MTRSLAITALAALSACSVGDSLEANSRGGLDSGAQGTTGTTTGTATGTVLNTPRYYAVTGNLEVQVEDIVPALSTVEIDYRNADEDSICSAIRAVSTATRVANPDPDLPLYGWWQVDLEVSPYCDHGPDSLLLGIGAWDPQLDAAAAAQNLNGLDLYGLYLQVLPVDPVFVFGASGTSEQFSGTTPPVAAAPLPDGLYQLRSLFLLPVASNP